MPEPSRIGLRRRLWRWAAAFGRFWVDFLIGDAPELFVGVVIVLAAAAAISAGGPTGSHVVAVVVVPLSVLAVLGLSLRRARLHR